MNHHKHTLTIVIVNWKSRDPLKQCLTSIESNLNQALYEIIIIDNNSLSNSEVEEFSQFQNTQVLRNSKNLGFARAINQGVMIATGHFTLILNPDCMITKNAIEPMITILENDSHIGIVGPLIVQPSGQIVRACRRQHPTLWTLMCEYTLITNLYHQFLELVRLDKWNKKYRQNGLTYCIQGSCLLVRTKQFIELGLFDERIPLYLDDMDLCLRYEKSGSLIYYHADSKIIHEGRQSIKNMRNPTISSLVNVMAYDLYFAKHKKPIILILHHIILFFLSLLLLIANIVFLVPLYLILKNKAIHYLEKHFWMFIYSITFCMSPTGFPTSWPRNFLKLFNIWG